MGFASHPITFKFTFWSWYDCCCLFELSTYLLHMNERACVCARAYIGVEMDVQVCCLSCLNV
jgi:hypothetical protein